MASFAQLIGPLDEQSRAPLYQQLRRALRDAIDDNRLAPEEAPGPERELAEEFGVSRITVRKALDVLVEEGMLNRRQGAGTFVAARAESRVEKSFSKLSSFSEDMISRGRRPESVWLSRASGTVTPEESLTLGLSPGSQVYRFNRIRYADGEPMALEYSTVPGFCLPSETAVEESLYETLERFGARPVRALQRLRAVLFLGEKAKLLGVLEGSPGLLIERRGFLRDGRPVEITQSYYRGDAYDFVAELSTSPRDRKRVVKSAVPSPDGPTLMFREAAEAPAVVRAQLEANAPAVLALAERLRRAPPRVVLTYARGSSDHAATYARYLMETRLGVITASAAPSVSSVYDAAPDMEGALCLVISQSGRSPDLLAAAHAAAEAGALVVAVVNDENSPLARMAEAVLPLRAGPERSVAATKSFLASLSAILQLTTLWSRDDGLVRALDGLPDLLESAWRLDWSSALEPLSRAQSLYVLGRGIGFGVAEEAALKLKETCGLHAEAFSSAELRHGPMALVGPGFPVLAFAQADETLQGVEAAARACAAQGAPVFLAGGLAGAGVEHLPAPHAHPALQTIAEAQSFYRFAESLARARGLDPDHPPHLSKVTETV